MARNAYLITVSQKTLFETFYLNDKMKIKYITFFAFTLIILLSIAWWIKTPSLSVESVNQLIEKEVPPKANISQVQAFLKSHEITSGKFHNRPDMDSDFLRNSKLDGKRERIKGMVGAIERDVETDFLMTWSISIKFYFDEEGKLVEYTVGKEGTGM